MKKKFSSGLTDIIAEHKGQMKKIWMLAVNDLIKKYKGAVMGPLWAIIKPTFTLFILWFAFTIGIRGSGTVSGYPRFIFMLSGYIPWFFISEVIVGGSRSIRQNSQFVTKLSFPVSNIMTFCTLASLIIHVGMCIIMYVILLTQGYGPSIYNLQIFYYMPLMFLFFLVLSWATAPLSAFSRDFENLVNSLITGLFWLSGILYDASKIEIVWVKKILLFNPVTICANGYRNVFIKHVWFWETPQELINYAIVLLVMAVLAVWAYGRLKKEIPDVL